MGERLLCKQEVIGSIPFTSTNMRPGRKLVDHASSSHRAGRAPERKANSVGLCGPGRWRRSRRRAVCHCEEVVSGMCVFAHRSVFVLVAKRAVVKTTILE